MNTDPEREKSGETEAGATPAAYGSDAQFSSLGDSICSLVAQTRDGCHESRNAMIEQLRTYMEVVASSRMNPAFQAKFGESDIVQQSLAVAMEKFDDFRGASKGELLNWVKTILNNEVKQRQRAFTSNKRNLFREEQIEFETSSGVKKVGLADNNFTPKTNALQREQAEAVQAAMHKLPDDYQKVIRLRNQEDLGFAEIGRQMDRSENAVTKLWFRALVQLRKELEDFGV